VGWDNVKCGAGESNGFFQTTSVKHHTEKKYNMTGREKGKRKGRRIGTFWGSFRLLRSGRRSGREKMKARSENTERCGGSGRERGERVVADVQHRCPRSPPQLIVNIVIQREC
jgi:hypothetical protein